MCVDTGNVCVWGGGGAGCRGMKGGCKGQWGFAGFRGREVGEKGCQHCWTGGGSQARVCVEHMSCIQKKDVNVENPTIHPAILTQPGSQQGCIMRPADHCAAWSSILLTNIAVLLVLPFPRSRSVYHNRLRGHVIRPLHQWSEALGVVEVSYWEVWGGGSLKYVGIQLGTASATRVPCSQPAPNLRYSPALGILSAVVMFSPPCNPHPSDTCHSPFRCKSIY